jgi:hypothetical protein
MKWGIEQVSSVGNASDLHLGGARFELGPKCYLLWRTFSRITSVPLCNVRFTTFNCMSVRTTSLHFPSRGLLLRYHLAPNSELLLVSVFAWWETEASWHGGHYLVHCTSPGWWMIRIVQPSGRLRGETELLGENLPQCHFVPQNTDMTWSGLETGLPPWKSGGERTSRHWTVLSIQM